MHSNSIEKNTLLKTMYRPLKLFKDKLMEFYETRINKDSFRIEMYRWMNDKGDSLLRLNYPLDSSSIVVDVGGFEGEFAEDLFNRFKCNIIIIEPIPDFYNSICVLFKDNSKIKVKPYALSDSTGTIDFFMNANASSQHNKTGNKLTVKKVSTSDFIEELKLNRIDLLKLNVEGAEYEILDDLIKNQFINNINYLQIQFHKIDNNSEVKRDKIREILKLTHDLQWDYTFIWESWVRKKV